MIAKIEEARFAREVDLQHGKFYSHIVKYDGKEAHYLSKYKDQKKFIPGQQAEFREEVVTRNGKQYIKIKPIKEQQGGYSNYGRKLQQEQSRYPGFSLAYAKDLVVAGKLELKQMFPTADKMVEWMLRKDKEIQDGK